MAIGPNNLRQEGTLLPKWPKTRSGFKNTKLKWPNFRSGFVFASVQKMRLRVVFTIKKRKLPKSKLLRQKWPLSHTECWLFKALHRTLSRRANTTCDLIKTARSKTNPERGFEKIQSKNRTQNAIPLHTPSNNKKPFPRNGSEAHTEQQKNKKDTAKVSFFFAQESTQFKNQLNSRINSKQSN